MAHSVTMAAYVWYTLYPVSVTTCRGQLAMFEDRNCLREILKVLSVITTPKLFLHLNRLFYLWCLFFGVAWHCLWWFCFQSGQWKRGRAWCSLPEHFPVLHRAADMCEGGLLAELRQQRQKLKDANSKIAAEPLGRSSGTNQLPEVFPANPNSLGTDKQEAQYAVQDSHQHGAR